MESDGIPIDSGIQILSPSEEVLLQKARRLSSKGNPIRTYNDDESRAAERLANLGLIKPLNFGFLPEPARDKDGKILYCLSDREVSNGIGNYSGGGI